MSGVGTEPQSRDAMWAYAATSKSPAEVSGEVGGEEGQREEDQAQHAGRYGDLTCWD